MDRIERIAKLFVRAGVRYRRNLRELDEKLNIIVNDQIESKERFARNEKRFEGVHARNEARFLRHEEQFARTEARFARNEERLNKLSQKTDQRFVQMAKVQALNDKKFAELMDILRKRRNGNRSTNK